MDPAKTSFPQALTFDDVLLLPGYSDFSRSDIDLSTSLTQSLTLTAPFVSAPMDTVTESELAIALARIGGIGIIHRNLTIAGQAEQVHLVKKEHLLVGAAVGGSNGYEDRVKALVYAGVDVLVVDSADGFTKQVIDATRFIKQTYKNTQVISGNVATFDGAKALIDVGADAIRVGMGPGAICTTRIISGMGVPQITAIMETSRAGKAKGIPIIADGGIKYSGDITKALAAGAAAVMMGSFFASSEEAPGRVVVVKRRFLPKRFHNLLPFGKMPVAKHKDKKSSNELTLVQDVGSTEGEEVFRFKEYRGMGSIGAMQKGAEIKSEGEFHGKSYKDKVLVAEGVEGLVPIKGTVQQLLDQAMGGIRSGMYHVGAKTITQLQEKAQFIQITQASLTESHPHSLLITNPGANYS